MVGRRNEGKVVETVSSSKKNSFFNNWWFVDWVRPIRLKNDLLPEQPLRVLVWTVSSFTARKVGKLILKSYFKLNILMSVIHKIYMLKNKSNQFSILNFFHNIFFNKVRKFLFRIWIIFFFILIFLRI